MAQDEQGKKILAEQHERIGHRIAEQIERGARAATQGEPDGVSPGLVPDAGEPKAQGESVGAFPDGSAPAADEPLEGGPAAVVPRTGRRETARWESGSGPVDSPASGDTAPASGDPLTANSPHVVDEPWGPTEQEEGRSLPMGIDSAGMASGPDPEPSSAGGPHSRDRSRSPRAADCVQGQTRDMEISTANFGHKRDAIPDQRHVKKPCRSQNHGSMDPC